MVEWKSVCGALLLLVVVVHTIEGVPQERHGKGNKAESDRSICGTDTSKNAVCYKATEGTAYETSKAVLRLSLGCTGWLVGDEGHILTNWHCIENAKKLDGVNFESMAEGERCNSECKKFLGCPGNIVNTDPIEFIMTGGTDCHNPNYDCVDDYTLLKLSKKDALAVKHLGYLKLRRTGPVLDERIYIPQHPAGWGKRIDMDEGGKHVTVDSIDEENVNYASDTRGGSSGSPVIGYSDNAVIAIHNQGGCTKDNGGTNTGVNINRVLDGLKGLLPESAYTQGNGNGNGNGNGGGCKDVHEEECPNYAKEGDCTTGEYVGWMKKYCKKSCGLCKDPNCKDDADIGAKQCKAYALDGDCTNKDWVGWMKKHCKSTCGHC